MAKRFSKLRQRFGIAAPKVSVRTHVPWYLRWLGIAVMLAFSAALALWMYDAGRRFAGFDRSEVEQELSVARSELGKIRDELERPRRGRGQLAVVQAPPARPEQQQVQQRDDQRAEVDRADVQVPPPPRSALYQAHRDRVDRTEPQ